MQEKRWQKCRAWLAEGPSLQRWWKCVELVEAETQESQRQLLRDYLLSHVTENEAWSAFRLPCGDWAPDFSGWALCHLPGQPLSLLSRATEIYCPPGRFHMGVEEQEGLSEGCPPMNVVLTRGFWVLSTPVTQEMFEGLLGDNPSYEQCDKESTGTHPVECVSWYDALWFCNQLSEAADLEPVYKIEQWETSWNREANGYRLLTEAEWEYACRAGSSALRYGTLEDVAWYRNNSDERTHPVTQKQPNAWGLYDTLGNVQEWCFDSGDEPRPEFDEHRDPVLETDGRLQVCRGGAWSSQANAVYASHCTEFERGSSDKALGFRIARNG